LTSAAVAGWTAATLVVVVEVDVDRSVGPIGAPVALSVGVVAVLRVVVVWVWAGAAGVPGTAVVVLRVVVVWVWSGVCWSSSKWFAAPRVGPAPQPRSKSLG
jgi:hypothetical protein